MSDDKLSFFEFDSLFRFEFTGPSLVWGFSIGTLLSCHKFNKSRNFIESVRFGGFLGFIVAAGIWGFNLYKFTMSRHILQQQNYARQESALKVKLIESYFKSKYNMEDSSSEQVAVVINELDEKWKKIESALDEDQ